MNEILIKNFEERVKHVNQIVCRFHLDNFLAYYDAEQDFQEIERALSRLETGA